MMATNAVTVTLGSLGPRAERMIEEGRYESLTEVLRAGVRALEREELAIDDYHRKLIGEALADPRPSISLEEAFARLDERAAARRGA